MFRWTAICILLAGVVLVLGCAGTVQHTEPGYMPTHVAVGEVIVDNTASTMSNERLAGLFVRNLENSLYDLDVRYIPVKELEESAVDPAKTVMLNMEVSFMQGVRMGTDVAVRYRMLRRSDGFLWDRGSCRASDLPDSEQSLHDQTTGIQFAAMSMAEEARKMLSGETAGGK